MEIEYSLDGKVLETALDVKGHFEIPYGVTSIGKYAFEGCSGLTSIVIPNSVTSIECDAFSDCSGLTSIEIPNSVTSIGDFAFSGCSGLTSIFIPNSVTNIGNFNFSDCEILESIFVDKGNKYYSSEDGVLYNKDKTEIIAYPCSKKESNFTIPNSVTSIGDYAFSHCSGLTSIEIPNSVTSIGNIAFRGCM